MQLMQVRWVQNTQLLGLREKERRVYRLLKHVQRQAVGPEFHSSKLEDI